MQAFALPARAGIRSRLSAAAVYLSCPEGKPESRNPPGALSKKGGGSCGAAAAPYRADTYARVTFTRPRISSACVRAWVFKRVQEGKVRGRTERGRDKGVKPRCGCG